MFPFFKLTREVILIKSVCQGRKCVFFFFFFTGLARPAHEFLPAKYFFFHFRWRNCIYTWAQCFCKSRQSAEITCISFWAQGKTLTSTSKLFAWKPYSFFEMEIGSKVGVSRFSKSLWLSIFHIHSFKIFLTKNSIILFNSNHVTLSWWLFVGYV